MKTENIFTGKDHKLINRAIEKLPRVQRRIIKLRFWKNLALYEIGYRLDMKVSDVEAQLEEAFNRLRQECLRDPNFSLLKILRKITKVAA